MPRPHPQEFRDDVIAVARRGDAPLAQVAKDFGISESCLRNWLRRADVDDGHRPGTTTQESAEIRDLRRRRRPGGWRSRTTTQESAEIRDLRRRLRLVEQENEVLRRAAAYLSQANLPGK